MFSADKLFVYMDTFQDSSVELTIVTYNKFGRNAYSCSFKAVGRKDALHR